MYHDIYTRSIQDNMFAHTLVKVFKFRRGARSRFSYGARILLYIPIPDNCWYCCIYRYRRHRRPGTATVRVISDCVIPGKRLVAGG